MKLLKLFVLIFVLSLSFEISAAIRCENIFLSKAEFQTQFDPENLSVKQSKKFLDSALPEKESGSTTGDRTEYKFTLSKTVLTEKLKAFKKAIESEIPEFTLTNRDPITPGYKNITLTTYSNRFKLKLASGQNIVAKIRLRKYGLIPNRKDILVENFKAIEGMQDVSFLEFKIQNPEYENSVLKPRIKILDQDAEALQNSELTANEYTQIEQRCITLNPMKDSAQQEVTNQTITLMLRAIRGLHKKDSLFDMEYETLYERTSYKAPIKNSETNETYEVQITLDENISARSFSFGYEAPNYKNQPEKIVVAEVKVPITLIELLSGDKIPHTPGQRRSVSPEQIRSFLNAADYQKFPGLKPVMDFLQTLQFNTLRSFEENHGKLFHLRQSIQKEFRP